jgi:hypothetical protein
MNSLSRCVLCLALLVLALPVSGQQQATKPVQVTIQEEKAEIIALPLDPTVRIEHQYTGNMQYGVTAEGKMLTCGAGAAHTLFKIDNQILFPDIVTPPEALPAGPNNKKRKAFKAPGSTATFRSRRSSRSLPAGLTTKAAPKSAAWTACSSSMSWKTPAPARTR